MKKTLFATAQEQIKKEEVEQGFTQKTEELTVSHDATVHLTKRRKAPELQAKEGHQVFAETVRARFLRHAAQLPRTVDHDATRRASDDLLTLRARHFCVLHSLDPNQKSPSVHKLRTLAKGSGFAHVR
jgi:hypothetical protein